MDTKGLGNLSPYNFDGKESKQNIGVKNPSKLLGDKGEDMACEYLVKNGYKILGRNYRITFGEIDIIAKKKGLFSDKTIHFIEVKSLANSAGDFFPEQRVDYKKQNKYKKLIEVWLDENNFLQNTPCQMDIVAIQNEQVTFFENIITS